MNLKADAGSQILESTLWRYRGGAFAEEKDVVVVEEPLEIRIQGRPFQVLMCTPGMERELALGFLHTEGIVRSLSDVVRMHLCGADTDSIVPPNVIDVSLAPASLERSGRRPLQVAYSSCSLCAKEAFDEICLRLDPLTQGLFISPDDLLSLLSRLPSLQLTFQKTGAAHAVALASPDGKVFLCAEDVGRHNALDKAIGLALFEGRDLKKMVALSSGRSSSEMVLKCIRAGIPILAGVSAPTSMALRLAETLHLTLVGFARGGGFNVYCHPERIASQEPDPGVQDRNQVEDKVANDSEKTISAALPEEISVDELSRMIDERKEDFLLIDVRGPEERVIGYIKGGLSIPHTLLDKRPVEFLPEKARPVVLYCSVGVRSYRTAWILQDLGYQRVRSLEGGFTAWVEAGKEIDLESAMTQDQARRYSRQMLLHEIGEKGQQKLLKASVLIVGAGGLGSPLGFYLAAAGVGRLGIVDFDRVDISNIHRQILHTTADVGRNKAESAQAAISRINPDVEVAIYRERFSPENALKIVSDYDIVVDGSDNFPTKFLLNDAAFFAGRPFVFGAAVRFDGQASVFYPAGGGPCLRCMMPEIPPAGSSFT